MHHIIQENYASILQGRGGLIPSLSVSWKGLIPSPACGRGLGRVLFNKTKLGCHCNKVCRVKKRRLMFVIKQINNLRIRDCLKFSNHRQISLSL